jgi:putative transcriptional regulator
MAVDVGRCQLRQLLKQRFLSQIELSEISGISKQKISDYANNRSIMSLSTAAHIANCLGCSIDDLYEFKCRGRQKK